MLTNPMNPVATRWRALSPAGKDLLCVVAILMPVIAVVVGFDLNERFMLWSIQHAEDYEMDEIPMWMATGTVAFAWYSYRRWRQYRRELRLHQATMAELLEAKDKIVRQERLSALGQAAGSVGHELRNPLSAIRNSTYSVRTAIAGKSLGIDRVLDRIERGVDRCDAIVSDILEFSRVQEVRRIATPIDGWLGEMMDEHVVSPAVAVRREFTAGAEVMLDRTRFRQVLVNLIDNAAQAMTDTDWEPEAGRCRTIIVRTETAGPHVRLIVADNGPGIPQGNLGKIFEPLFTTKAKGIGLGLPTVLKLIEQHGGSINVESNVGAGTAFTVLLPRHVEAAPRAASGIVLKWPGDVLAGRSEDAA